MKKKLTPLKRAELLELLWQLAREGHFILDAKLVGLHSDAGLPYTKVT